jgi:hypothetical protein
MKAAATPRPIRVGNVEIRWVKPGPGGIGGYPLPGGRFTQDPYEAAQVAALISGLSKPVPPEPHDVRAERIARVMGEEA